MKQLIFIFLPPAKITAGNVAAVLVAAVSFWMTFFVDPGKHPIGPEHLYRSIVSCILRENGKFTFHNLNNLNWIKNALLTQY
ncbi:hypothetical protein T01_13641 [Trichinella spiralis]|uniref:Uncharacterized protein n=1 Tax=Trichinella spiralis TaxID=6334 RepID=A0A0V1C1U5_TRISP|nr:hypothetical protein T01_13641 [Trichinella spiralis]